MTYMLPGGIAGATPFVLASPFYQHLDDSVLLEDANSTSLFQILSDQVVLSLQMKEYGVFYPVLQDTVTLGDVLAFAYRMEMLESLILTDDIASLAKWIAELEDAMTFGLTQKEYGFFNETLISGILLADLLRSPLSANLSSTLLLSEELASVSKTVSKLVESLVFSDALSNTLSFWTSLADGVVLSDVLSWTAIYNMLLEDEVVFSGRIVLDGIDYVAWVVNPKNAAFSHYSNYPFNSFVELGDRAFGLEEEGVFELEGDDDEGTDIAVKMRTGLMDFGTGNLKNVRHGYLGLASGGTSLYLRTVAVKNGQKRRDHYTLRPRSGDVVFEARQTFSNSIVSRYWGFEIENAAGEPVELDNMELGIILFPRKI